MGKCYRHIQPSDRLKIYELLFQGHSIDGIAQEIGFHRSTLYRELERNSCKFGYRPDVASQQYLSRRQRPTKLTSNLELREFVITKLKEGWSPDSIAGRLKANLNQCIISTETIYRFIYSEQGMKLKLYRHLMKKRRFRYPRIKRRRKTIANALKKPIKERDEEINQRQSYGHWEGDLLLFKHTKTNLFTLRERKSRFIIAIKNQSRQAQSTTNALLKYMKASLKKTMKSLTLDNDPAFALHQEITAKTKSNIYFCEPYKSYQKGAIENANKLLRTKLPRQTKIDGLEQNQIDEIVKKLNDRPMKCLQYQTPKEVFDQAFGRLSDLIGSRTSE
jgi:transposase, IS30 family